MGILCLNYSRFSCWILFKIRVCIREWGEIYFEVGVESEENYVRFRVNLVFMYFGCLVF